MIRSPRLLVWGAIAAALPVVVTAQTIYKSVGADGRVTYSQQPPSDQNVKHEVIRGKASAAAPAPAAPAQAPDASGQPEARTTARLPAKKAIGSASVPASARPEANAGSESPAAAAAPNATPSAPGASNDATRAAATPPATVTADLDPALEKALIGVLGYEDLVHQAGDLCVGTLPLLMSKVDDARKGWDARNAAVVAKARQVMQAVSPAKRQLIEAAVKATNGANLSVVRQAAPTSRIAWCGRTVDEVKSGALDLERKPNLSSPLMAYRG